MYKPNQQRSKWGYHLLKKKNTILHPTSDTSVIHESTSVACLACLACLTCLTGPTGLGSSTCLQPLVHHLQAVDLKWYDVFDCTDEYTHLYGNNMPNQYFWRKWSWQTTSSSSTISDYFSYLIINPPKISLLAWQILDILSKNVYPQLMSKDKVVLNYAVAWPTLSILLVLCVCLKMGHTLQMNIFNRYNEVSSRFSDRPIWRSAVECKIWTI